LAFVAADNFVQKNEINNLKLDFWRQQETYINLRSETFKEKQEARERLQKEVTENMKLKSKA
jgi:hypothetical protein